MGDDETTYKLADNLKVTTSTLTAAGVRGAGAGWKFIPSIAAIFFTRGVSELAQEKRTEVSGFTVAGMPLASHECISKCTTGCIGPSRQDRIWRIPCPPRKDRIFFLSGTSKL